MWLFILSKQTMNKIKTIPDVLNKINESTGDRALISYYENIMVSMYASSLLFIAAIVNFLVRFNLQKFSIGQSLVDSLFFILLAILFWFVVKIKINVKIMNWIIAILSGLTLIYIFIRFYDVIGPAVWTVAFIQLSLALVRISKSMLMLLELATIIAFFYSIYHTFENQFLNLDLIYFVVQFVLFLVLSLILASVHQINVNRYFSVEKKYQEVTEKNVEIELLNDVIKKSEEQAKDIAYHDILTGLPNRYYLTTSLNRIINQCKCKDRFLGVFFMDLDDFKLINDTMGHDMGDALLKMVAQRLKNSMRENDLVARIGGDEFIILIQSLGEYQEMDTIARQILDCFKQPYHLDGQKCYITTSLGLAICPTDGDDGETLIKHADIAMYKAKEKGKNQYVRFSEAMKKQIHETMEITHELYEALNNREFELFYQPQINVLNGKIVGIEALIRWHHQNRGLLLPNEFMKIAEKTSLINEIGEWVLYTACQQAKEFQDLGATDLRISVNLSARELLHPQIAERIESIIRETGLAHNCLELEITEKTAMMEKEKMPKILESLKKTGVHMTIDDFGSEYASLKYLKKLPIDRIKIPMLNINGDINSDTDKAFTKAIIVLARDMGCLVTAEGVQTKKQYEFLNQRMCDEVQGYYYHKPLSVTELKKLLVEQHLSNS
jgi:diguanylate cyclase (GGDEF)-like protein